MVKNTSVQAFHEQVRSGRDVTQRELIYDYIKHHPDCTRNMIEKGTGIRISSVTARVNELVSDGKINVTGTRRCPITEREVESLLTQSETQKGWERWKNMMDRGVL